MALAGVSELGIANCARHVLPVIFCIWVATVVADGGPALAGMSFTVTLPAGMGPAGNPEPVT